MRYLIFFILATILCVPNALAETTTFSYEEDFTQEPQESLFNISNQEEQSIESMLNLSSSDIIRFYPILKIDFFNVRDPENYKGSWLTKTFKQVSLKKNTVLGLRFRLTIGYSSK